MSKVNKEILALAIPNIVSNVSVPLLSSVDTILMGQLSVKHLAAIGVGGMIFNLLYWNFGFLRMATTGMTAQSHGAKDGQELTILVRGVVLALAIAAMLILARGWLMGVLAWVFSVQEAEMGMVSDYFQIRIWEAPASLLLYVAMGWLFGKQNAWAPMILMVVINVVNIGMSYYLVKVQSFGVVGVAMGTVIAQYVGLCAAFSFIGFRYGAILRKSTVSTVLGVQVWLKYLRANTDIFVRTVCLTTAFTIFYSQSYALGVVIMGANVILLQFVNWMSYGVDGFAYASESLVGKYAGQGEKGTLHEVVRQSFWWAFAVALGFSLVFYFCGSTLILVFSEDPAAVTLADRLLPYVWLFPILGFASYVWDGVYVGLLATKSMRNTKILALGLYLLCLVSLPTYSDGSHLWIALLMFVVARGAFQTIMYWRYTFSIT